MPTRDERADLRSGAGVVEGPQGDGQPVKRSKPRVGHGEATRILQPIKQIVGHTFFG
jgi:hypothetical protein